MDEPLFQGPQDTVQWESPLADFYPLTSPDEWDNLRLGYEADRHEDTHNLLPWRRCLAVALGNKAVCAVVEKRYICYDFQSEFAAFYSHVLAGVPQTTHRVHFFRKPVSKSNYRRLSREDALSYLGYVVCRPRDLEIVGRTMLRPPSSLPVLTTSEDDITFFGQPLHVSAVPFMQQDERLGACANIAAWVVHHSAFRRHQLGRRLAAEFMNRTTDFLRPKAIIGLDSTELVGLLNLAGFRTHFYQAEPADSIPQTQYHWNHSESRPERLLGVYDEEGPQGLSKQQGSISSARSRLVEECCRNLNSGMPLIAAGVDHTLVVCGYRLVTGERLAEFVVHDDQRGPYLFVADCLLDRVDLRTRQAPPDLKTSPFTPADARRELQVGPSSVPDDLDLEWFEWSELIVPLPEMAFLDLHMAERAGNRLLVRKLAPSKEALDEGRLPVQELEALLDASYKANSLRYRTYLTRANEFKRRLKSRGASSKLAREYAGLRLAEWIVVVEFVDTRGPLSKQRALGEAIFDGTSNPKEPLGPRSASWS